MSRQMDLELPSTASGDGRGKLPDKRSPSRTPSPNRPPLPRPPPPAGEGKPRGRSGRSLKETLRSHSVSCTPTQWSRIGLRARHADMPLARFIVSRCLSGVFAPGENRDERTASDRVGDPLERERDDRLREAVEWMSLEIAPGTPWIVDQGRDVRSRCGDWMEEMVIHGRRDRLEEILRDALGRARAERVVATLLRRLPRDEKS